MIDDPDVLHSFLKFVRNRSSDPHNDVIQFVKFVYGELSSSVHLSKGYKIADGTWQIMVPKEMGHLKEFGELIAETFTDEVLEIVVDTTL